MYFSQTNAANNFLSGSQMFVVADGVLELFKRGVRVGHLEPGKVFGEWAILYGWPRTATIKCEVLVADENDSLVL